MKNKSKEEIAIAYGLCNCDEAYTLRGMTAPDCPWHSFAVEEAMDEWKDQETARLKELIQENKTSFKQELYGNRKVIKPLKKQVYQLQSELRTLNV